MMNIIKRSILIFVCFILVFSCCPVISKADILNFNGIEFNISTDYSNINLGSVHAVGSNYDRNQVWNADIVFGAPNFRLPNDLTGFRYALAIVKDQSPNFNGFYHFYYLFSNKSLGNGSNYTFNGTTLFYQQSIQYSIGSVWFPTSYSTDMNAPVFILNGINDRTAISNYLINGDLSGSVQENGTPSLSPDELGFIKPSYYVNNALLTGPMTVADSPETITWQNVSTTGYDLNQDGVQIRFMIKDRSVYQRNENAWGSGTLGTINNFITNVTGFLSSNLFPNGSWQKSWLRGDVTRSDTHEQFFGQKFSYPGSSGKASFNWLASYRDHPQIQISTYANDMLTTNKSFYESLYQNTLGDFTIPYISWDIYAQIIAPDGTEGNWLKIDKHAAPFQEQGNRLDGGVTEEPVTITPTVPDNNTWNDGDETPINDDDDDDDDPLPVGYVDPGSGDTNNEYNNYTYNYDNRSWVTNNYTNEIMNDANEGMDWIHLFSGFFSIFLLLFGPFLPDWAVTLVTVATPIIIGLCVFKLIKGVIPFA